jgi:two-component system response regulator
VLRRIKLDPELKTIPTVMLTTIEEKEEMIEAYALGANSYVTKPVQFAEFVEKVKLVGLYWLLTNARPKD